MEKHQDKKNVVRRRLFHIVMIVFFVIAIYNVIVILQTTKKESECMLIIGMGALILAGICIFVFFIKYEIERKNSVKIKKELEDEIVELLQDKESLQEDNETKSVFVGKMSKELRSHVDSILGMDELILQEDNLEIVTEHAARIRNVGYQLRAMISDVLDLTLMEENKLEIVEEEYDTKEMLVELIRKSKRIAQEKKLDYELMIEESVPCRLIGDYKRIRQALFYMLSNAVKYTPLGSISFCMGWENRSQDEIDLIFMVSDTGVGIKEEELTKLMDGAGIGLIITTKLLAAMGTKLEIESEYGQGTTFSFRLRQKLVNRDEMGCVSQHVEEKEETLIEKKGFLAPNVRLLAVDDNEINLAVIKGLLKATRIQVDTALSGKECIQMAMENQYHIILMDYMMPEMDGIQTMDQLRMFEENQSKDAAVIVLTAENNNGDKEKFLGHGFADYLYKPVENEKLQEMLMKHIPESMLIKADTHEEKMAEQVLNIKSDLKENENNALEGLVIQAMLADDFGIYVQEGLRYCDGNVDQYRETLKVFLSDAPGKYGKLSYAIAQDNAPEYEIVIHSLKTDAKIVGALELGKAAQELEDLCNSGQWSLTKRKHNRFGRKLKEIIDGLKQLEEAPISYDETPTSMTNEEVLFKVREIEKHLLDFELELASTKLEKLVQVKTSEDVHLILMESQELMKTENYDGLVDQLEKIAVL